MATAEQRSGFRLPWASEAPADAAPDVAAVESADAPTEPHTPEANVSDETSTATMDTSSAAWPNQDAPPERAARTAETNAEPVEGDSSGPTQIEATPVVASTRARRDNPLVAGLVRAMREAAEAARAESLTRFSETAKSRVEEIQAESATAGEEIRHQSEADVAGIRDWSKAEMARVREATEERITDRKRQLEEEIEEHAAQVEHRVELVQAAVQRFEDDMNRFYERLLAEEDPARLAGFAEQLPEPPALDGELDGDGWTPPRTLAADDAAAAEAAYLSELRARIVTPSGDARETGDPEVGAADAAAMAATKTPDAEGLAPDAEAGAPVADPEAVDDTVDDPHVVERLASFTDAPEETAETETTSLSVVGLVSVASIASFKRAVARSVGVRGVSVASGPKGDFIFTVQHAVTTDLRTIIPELDRFKASITSDTDGVLSVNASEPGEES